ncbi:hypothetical protein FALBO_2278 [Fusarium albosuccineum]|uniref:RING-type domain-containing protein n=1 Tax=Fusarium albosuccineum TaxID=1237068 RepID=A0A8H4LNH2_9HYPO|nr:hypothetical protein FALBO_2278 [Fusarium albosuccineum]
MSDNEPTGESFWPVIKHQIHTNTQAPGPSPIKPQCPICLEDMSVVTFPDPTRPGEEPRRAYLVPCGHIVCKPCHDTARSALGLGEQNKCPVCRTPLQCTRCGHHALRGKVPTAGGPVHLVDLLDLTMPEGGAFQSRCPECVAGDAFLDKVDAGDLPADIADIETGFVSFIYHTIESMEEQHRQVGKNDLLSVFRTILDAEWDKLMRHRDEVTEQINQEHRMVNPCCWFGDICLRTVHPGQQQAIPGAHPAHGHGHAHAGPAHAHRYGHAHAHAHAGPAAHRPAHAHGHAHGHAGPPPAYHHHHYHHHPGPWNDRPGQ